MTTKQDFKAYQESVTSELNAINDRITNLIGPVHWLTAGEYKETILRDVIKRHLPETLRTGKGFVCFTRVNRFNRKASHQIDILITDKRYPVLMKVGELSFVTPEPVEAIIEVKTNLPVSNVEKVLRKLCDQAESVRSRVFNKICKVGLFVFKPTTASHKHLLNTLQKVTDRNPRRVINFISLGQDIFIRYWENGRNQVHSPIDGGVWHLYRIENFAQPYFINNIVIELSHEVSPESEVAWFPIEGTKERYRRFYIPLLQGHVNEF